MQVIPKAFYFFQSLLNGWMRCPIRDHLSFFPCLTLPASPADCAIAVLWGFKAIIG